MRVFGRFVLFSGLLVACGGDGGPALTSSVSNFTSVSGGAASMDPSGEPEPSDAGEDTDTPTGGTPDPTNDTSNVTTNEPTNGTTNETGGDPCDGIDCSGHGTCIDMAGTATCECADGYVSEGLACVACPLASGEFAIDIPMVTISGAKTVNGKTVDAPDSGYLSFVNSKTGDSVGLGNLGTNPYSVNIVPGTYDLVYDYDYEAEGIPRNNHAVIQEGLALGSSKSLAIDIPMVTISGAKTVNGKTVDAPDSGYLSFVNSKTGDSVGLGNLGTNPYSVNIVPGTYDLVYDYDYEAEGIPRNNRAVIQEGLALGTSKSLAIDIPMVTISGAKTVNGEAVNAPDSGYLSFVNRETGDSVGLGNLGTNPYSVNIVPGTYDLVYDYDYEAEGIPRNNHAVIQEGLALGTSKSLAIDIPMVTISGAKTVNGKTVNAPDSGYLSFVNRETGDSVGLGNLGTNPYSVNIVPGTYDLVYDYDYEAEGIPRNNHAVIQEGLALGTSKSLAIDIPMVTISGAKTVNGETVNAPDSGYLSFVNSETGDSVGLGNLGTNPYSVNIVPGTYDLVYDYDYEAEGIPRNNRAVIQEGLALGASKSLAIDIPMVTISGAKTVNGKTVNAPDSGYLSFVNRETGDSVGLGNLGTNPYSVNIVPGTYRVVYDYDYEAEGIPHNNQAELACVQIQ